MMIVTPSADDMTKRRRSVMRTWVYGMGFLMAGLISSGCGPSASSDPSAAKDRIAKPAGDASQANRVTPAGKATPARNASQAGDASRTRSSGPSDLDSPSSVRSAPDSTSQADQQQRTAKTGERLHSPGTGSDAVTSRASESIPSTAANSPSGKRQPPARMLGELLEGRDVDQLFPGSAAGQFGNFSLPTIDEPRVESVGVRKFAGQHLTLYTDLADPALGQELVTVFDLAVPQWCRYFGVEPQKATAWKMVGYLMQDRDKFTAAGLIPADLPPFLHGYQRGAQLWLNEQPTDYYRRHLLLHEGTHGFMEWSLGGCGPPWYMEGVAELLATHRWEPPALTLNVFPASKEATPHWGRIKVIKDERAAYRALPLEQILQFDNQAHLRLEPYAWSWAAAAFLDRHPAYREAFRGLQRQVRAPGQGLSAYFYETQTEQWAHLSRQWQYFVMRLDYGFDIEREAIEQRPVEQLGQNSKKVTIQANHGWQSTGLHLEAGQAYQIRAQGQFTLAQQPKPWVSEANGVTLRYYAGKPLGLLLGAIVDETQPLTMLTALVTPEPLGLEKRWLPSSAGTLYLRINDSPAELADNTGQLEVTIEPSP